MGWFAPNLATSKNICSNKKYFLLLQALILSLREVAMSSLQKHKAKVLLRKAQLSSGIICVAEVLQLFDCLLVFESQVSCQLYKKIVNKWLLKLETLKLIMCDAQENLALLIEQSSLLLKQESLASTRSKTYGRAYKAADTFELLHFKGMSIE